MKMEAEIKARIRVPDAEAAVEFANVKRALKDAGFKSAVVELEKAEPPLLFEKQYAAVEKAMRSFPSLPDDEYEYMGEEAEKVSDVKRDVKKLLKLHDNTTKALPKLMAAIQKLREAVANSENDDAPRG